MPTAVFGVSAAVASADAGFAAGAGFARVLPCAAVFSGTFGFTAALAGAFFGLPAGLAAAGFAVDFAGGRADFFGAVVLAVAFRVAVFAGFLALAVFFAGICVIAS
jgi:hypothetical protein